MTKPYVDIWRELSVQFSTYVITESKAENLFQYDSAGNNCKPLFVIDDYDLVFIHNSQNGDGLIPSNIIDMIKSILNEKLVLFSGSISEQILNKQKGAFYSCIKRDKLENRLSSFLKKSQLLGEWKLEILFYDYENILIGKIIEMIDNDVPFEIVINSDEIKDYLALKNLQHSNPKYKQLFTIDLADLPNYLRSL